MENKNTIIALVLMAVVWFGFSFLFPEPPVQNPGIESPQATAQTAAQDADPAPVEPAAEPALPVASQVDFSEAREIIIETELFHAVLTSSGGRLKTLRLKNFRQSPAETAPQVMIVDAQTMSETTLQTSGRDGWSIPRDALYQSDAPGTGVALSGADERSVVMVWQDNSGLRVEKTFTFSGNSYDIDLQIKLSNQGASSREGGLTLTLVQPWSEEMEGSGFDFVGPVTLVQEDLKTDDVDDLAKEIKVYQDPAWTAFTRKYFMTGLIPLAVPDNKVTISRQGNLVLNSLQTDPQTLAPGETVVLDYLAYFGPRDLDILRQVGHRLEEAIDFGFFTFLALPLRYVLNFFYGYVGNYGVAIILLTVIIKLLFWPLTQKSYTSMKSMQKLQPEMQRLREKHKNDKERLNKEMMQMYKEKRVNPLGGCLPMLVQIPVFFALYKTLMIDIGLRHAPFVFWLQDLSAKDPYYITPVIMGASMFVQQKMSPTTMDPNQAKIFMMMPIIFTFMFLNFPAGLVLYWLVNNLLTIFQQYLIHRKPA